MHTSIFIVKTSYTQQKYPTMGRNMVTCFGPVKKEHANIRASCFWKWSFLSTPLFQDMVDILTLLLPTSWFNSQRFSPSWLQIVYAFENACSLLAQPATPGNLVTIKWCIGRLDVAFSKSKNSHWLRQLIVIYNIDRISCSSMYPWSPSHNQRSGKTSQVTVL